MQMEIKTPDRKPISKLSMVNHFREVIESRDILLMKKNLYQLGNTPNDGLGIWHVVTLAYHHDFFLDRCNFGNRFSHSMVDYISAS